jgi:hypothetical protein
MAAPAPTAAPSRTRARVSRWRWLVRGLLVLWWALASYLLIGIRFTGIAQQLGSRACRDRRGRRSRSPMSRTHPWDQRDARWERAQPLRLRHNRRSATVLCDGMHG